MWEVDVKTPSARAGKVDLRLIDPPIDETEFPHPTRRYEPGGASRAHPKPVTGDRL
jgi:hypothetical protein